MAVDIFKEQSRPRGWNEPSRGEVGNYAQGYRSSSALQNLVTTLVFTFIEMDERHWMLSAMSHLIYVFFKVFLFW